MTNPILIKPTLSEPFPNVPKIWTDPITGLKVPKNPTENLLWRAKLLKKAEKDAGLQQDLWAACIVSKIFWFNAFAFTFNRKITDSTGKEINNPSPHIGFVTWAIQDKLIQAVDKCIREGGDILIDKSRQMGASWMLVACLHHEWLFTPDSKILELSRIETYVDSIDDKSLFWKHDYINKWLPGWMRPPKCQPTERNRVRMRISNVLNGSELFGEATTRNAARGSTRSIVLLDEFSAVENGTAMRKATDDVTPCRIINGTAKAGTEYSRWATSGDVDVFKLAWYEHPQKGAGRYVEYDKLLKKYFINSPWHKREEERRDPKALAEEIDMFHMGAGSTFFDLGSLENYRAMYCKPPKDYRTINFVKGIANDVVSKLIRSGKIDKIDCRISTSTQERLNGWKFWCPLSEGRPDQNENYVFGIDISKGQGASNSVIAAYSADKRQKIGEWANSRVPPHEFARIVVASALWFGGRNPRRMPFIVWEANGDPGIEFGRMMVKVLGYPYYYRDQAAGVIGVARQKKKYGFHSNAEKKAELLGEYSQALAQFEIFNFSEDALNEAMTYIVFENGQIGPSVLLEEKSGSRLAHGDRVIADALAKRGMRGNFKRKEQKAQAPYNSPAWRKEQYDKQFKRTSRNFNWRHKLGI